MNQILLFHLLISAILLGVFLYKQFVQYPLFKNIPRNSYPVYAYRLKKKLKVPELILLLLEGVSAIALFVSPPELARPIFFQTNLMLLGMVWIYKYQLETDHLHQLNTKFSLEKHRKLVKYHSFAVLVYILRVSAISSILVNYI